MKEHLIEEKACLLSRVYGALFDIKDIGVLSKFHILVREFFTAPESNTQAAQYCEHANFIDPNTGLGPACDECLDKTS